jgi:hypothetical protein
LSKRRQLKIGGGGGIAMMDEESKIDLYGQLSPTAGHAMRDVAFKNIDHPSMLSAAMSGMQHISLGRDGSPTPSSPTAGGFSRQAQFCACGLPCQSMDNTCESCQGKNSIHIEGEIWKKQKKGGILKKY